MEKTIPVIEKAKALLDAIDKNEVELWSTCLEHTHGCVILEKADVILGVDENFELDDTTEFSGIMNEYNALKEAIDKDEE